MPSSPQIGPDPSDGSATRVAAADDCRRDIGDPVPIGRAHILCIARFVLLLLQEVATILSRPPGGWNCSKVRDEANLGSHAIPAPHPSSLRRLIVRILLFGEKVSDDIVGGLKSLLPKSFSDIIMVKRLCSSAEPKSGHSSDLNTSEADRDAWVVAAAAPHHMTMNSNLLSGAITMPPDMYIKIQGTSMKVHSRGDVVTDTVELHDVCLVPGLTKNVVSISMLTQLGYSVVFGCGLCCIRRVSDGMIVGEAHLSKGDDYILDFLRLPPSM